MTHFTITDANHFDWFGDFSSYEAALAELKSWRLSLGILCLIDVHALLGESVVEDI